jgi:hypothetical protein
MFLFSFLLADGFTQQVNYVEQTIKETVRTNFPETWIWDLVSIE